MKPKINNFLLTSLLVLIFANFFHIYNYFIFPLRATKYIPNLVVEINYYFFIIIFFLFFFLKKISFSIKDYNINYYFIFLFLYYLIIEFLYSKNFYFLNFHNPYSIMTINYINLILGYFLFSFLFENINIKQFSFVVKVNFMLFSILLIFYIITTKIFFFTFIDNDNQFFYDIIINLKNYDFIWNFSYWLREQKTFTSNTIIYAFSFLYLLTFETSKYKLEKFAYLILYLLIFKFYNDFSNSRSALLIFLITISYFAVNISSNIQYRKILIIFISIIFILFAQKIFIKFSQKISTFNISITEFYEVEDFDNYEFDKNKLKEKNPNIESFGEIESDIVRFGTAILIFKNLLSDFQYILFGASIRSTLEIKVLNYSSHSILINFISSSGLVLFLVTIYFFTRKIGLKKFMNNSTYFLIVFLLIAFLFDDKFYSYYSIIIYFLVNKNINFTKLNEKN